MNDYPRVHRFRRGQRWVVQIDWGPDMPVTERTFQSVAYARRWTAAQLWETVGNPEIREIPHPKGAA